IDEDSQQHRSRPAPAVASDAEKQPTRGPADHEDGSGETAEPFDIVLGRLALVLAEGTASEGYVSRFAVLDADSLDFLGGRLDLFRVQGAAVVREETPVLVMEPKRRDLVGSEIKLGFCQVFAVRRLQFPSEILVTKQFGHGPLAGDHKDALV